MDVPLADHEPLAGQPAFTLDRPAQCRVPVVFVSAHSGQDYPADLLSAARLDPQTLRRSEDSFVDELFAAAPSLGAPLLRAHFARAYCDANREAWELDPAMFHEMLPAWVNTSSARVTAGLGTIARIVASGEAIYRDKLRFTDAEHRVRTLWQPFHAALAAVIAETREKFGACLVVDCHSMPASGITPRGAADVVLGDAHGTTCPPAIVRAVEQTLAELGYRSRRNEPYAGGYITRHYGRPRDGVCALQIELARTRYMDETTMARSAAFARVRDDMTALMRRLIIAAEALRPH